MQTIKEVIKMDESYTTSLRSKGPISVPFVSSFEKAAARWKHADFEFDPVVLPNIETATNAEFSILNLKPIPVPPASYALPAHDPFGWPHGEAYTPLLKARTPLHSTRAVIPGFKLDRLVQALSMSEFRVLMKIAFLSNVLDFREQYGIYNRNAFWKAKSQGRRMRREHLMTIDVVVTYVEPPDFELKYHAVSVKHADYRQSERDLKREERERKVMEERGWTWELIRGDAIPELEFVNLRLLYIFARDTHLPSLYEAARQFAPVVLRSSNRGSLDAVMLRVARNMSIGLDAAYRRFAAAVAYGHLQIDHAYELDIDATLHLIRGRRS